MTDFEWVAVALVAITSAARITRLFVWDKYPPIMAIRMRWDRLTARPADRKPEHMGRAMNRENWNLLLHCGYCFSFWAFAAVLAWGYLTDWQTAWWLVNTALGGSYLSAILMSNDGDE